MRDFKRIKKVLFTIRSIWEKNPDLRLMQLLINVVGDNAYYLEDDKLIELLLNFYKIDEDDELYED